MLFRHLLLKAAAELRRERAEKRGQKTASTKVLRSNVSILINFINANIRGPARPINTAFLHAVSDEIAK